MADTNSLLSVSISHWRCADHESEEQRHERIDPIREGGEMRKLVITTK